jgi:hypothetical protein
MPEVLIRLNHPSDSIIQLGYCLVIVAGIMAQRFDLIAIGLIGVVSTILANLVYSFKPIKLIIKLVEKDDDDDLDDGFPWSSSTRRLGDSRMTRKKFSSHSEYGKKDDALH